ncbi:protein NATD1-like isoform X2 [Photinus pyralis]|uniref:protein NATD1-like isoform X2 n=1 Tax=Photinus pyralis TaxID=7054 RepID=UPI0012670ABC|nr:protein NATD1-like isoform X2 [Photinus pyralis]
MSKPYFTRSFSRSQSKINELQDQPERKILSLQLDERNIATVQYERNGDTVDLIHSEIPSELQGKGYGHILAQKTFDYIVENNLRMKITCEFLQKVFEKNKSKYGKYVA